MTSSVYHSSFQLNVMPDFSFAIPLWFGMSASLSTVTVGRSGSTSPPTRFREMIRKHRYYDPLRLPNARLGFPHSSLMSTDTLHAFISASYNRQLAVSPFIRKHKERTTPGVLL